MFLHSSKSIRSKILTASIEADQHYRRYRHTRGGGMNNYEDDSGDGTQITTIDDTQKPVFNNRGHYGE
jgi:hypothetical protein